MKGLRFVSEAFRTMLSRPVTTGANAMIVAAVCGAILSTTGQTVATERAVLGAIDQAGTRAIVVVDVDGTARIPGSAVARVADLSGVEWAIGLGPAIDVRNSSGHGSDPVPMRSLVGVPPSELRLFQAQSGRRTALAGPAAVRTLGFLEGIGGAETSDSADVAVVGWFEADEPLLFLNGSLLWVPEDTDSSEIRSIHVLASSPNDVSAVEEAILIVLGAEATGSIEIETAEELADIRTAVRGELGRFGRELIWGVLGVGLVLTSITVFAGTNARRRDFGRQRALGATRGSIVSLILLQSVMTAALGSSIGVGVAAFVLPRIGWLAPDGRFALAVACLAVLTAAIASLPSAVLAAIRDPVRILRVP